MSDPKTASDLAILRRLIAEARPCAPQIALLFAIGLLAPPLALLVPLPLKIAVDSALGSEPLPGPFALWHPAEVAAPAAALAIAVALLIGTALLRQAQDLATQILRTYTLEKLTLDLRARLFRHAQRLSVCHHDRAGTTDSTYRIQSDVPAAQSVVIESLLPSVASALTVVGMFAVTARLDWQLAVAALVISPLLVLIHQGYRRAFKLRWREAKQFESAALSQAQEVLAALRVVKAFGQEDREFHRFVHRSGLGMAARVRLAAVEGGFGLVVGLVTALGTAIVLYLGIRHVRAGQLTLGQLLLVMGYLTQLYDPLKSMSKRAAGLQSKFISAERVFALLDDAPDVVDRPRARPLGRARGRVTYEAVSFGYGDGRAVLEDISFELPHGARLGISGETGAGKTTLVNLLVRFHDPAAGRILLDGVDLRDWRLADLRRQFALVPQEPLLFSTTIGENIAYARPSAGRAAIVAAARAAHAHAFIERLPMGYDTPVGERGMSLSGGERQRLSLARAYLKDAPILVLDEPTSAVDLRTEALIVEALDRLMRGRTTVMIAHRTSTLRSCDVRLTLERGRLAEAAAAAAAVSLVAP